MLHPISYIQQKKAKIKLTVIRLFLYFCIRNQPNDTNSKYYAEIRRLYCTNRD